MIIGVNMWYKRAGYKYIVAAINIVFLQCDNNRRQNNTSGRVLFKNAILVQ
jgi:hypothetical protein